MDRPSGIAAVRLLLGTLVFAALSMSLVQPAAAGTADAPEIQDPAGDQSAGCAPAAGCQTYSRIDILSVWIDGETDTTINVNILVNGVPGAPTTHSSHWHFHATYGGTEVVATADSPGGGQAATPPVAGENVAAVAVDGNTLIMTIEKAVYGTVVSGTPLTSLFVEGSGGTPAPLPFIETSTDRAPNDGFGTDYTFGGPGGPTGCPNCTADDTDGDGLNDTWETEYFGNTTAQNATGDPDGDGLTNGQEEELGTDPTKADTDGDGCDDKADSAPTDPSTGCGGGSNGTTTTSGTRTTSTSTTSGTRTGTTTGNGTGDDSDASPGTCADGDTSDAVDCLESDLGYIGMSAGGFLAVLVLCIVALATRWSL